MTDELTLRLVEDRRNKVRWLAYLAKQPPGPTQRQVYEHAKLCCRLRVPPGVAVDESSPERDMRRRVVALGAPCEGGGHVVDLLPWEYLAPEQVRIAGRHILNRVDLADRAQRMAQRARIRLQPCDISITRDAARRVE